MDFGTVVPIVAATVTGAFLLANSRAIIAWGARQTRKTNKEQGNAAVAVAKIEDGAKERQERSADTQWLIGQLRGEIDKLTTRLDGMATQLEAVRAEKDQRIAILEKRVDTLDTENFLLRRELARHGIPVPRAATQP